MKIQERLIYIIGILVLTICLQRSCVSNLEMDLRYQKSYLENQMFKVQHEQDSSKLYSMAVNYESKLELANRKAMALSLIKLRKPEVITKIAYKTNIKTEIPVDTPVNIDSSLYIKLPQNINQLNRWFSFNGIINTKGVLVIDSFITTGSITHGIGDTLRGGFFNRIAGKKDKVVRVHIDNPHMEITNMANIVVKDDKKWYQTTAFKIIVGGIIGFAAAKRIK